MLFRSLTTSFYDSKTRSFAPRSTSLRSGRLSLQHWLHKTATSGTAALYSIARGSLPASARAKPPNWTKPRNYNSKKLAIERQKRQQQLTKSRFKKLQRWLDNRPKLSVIASVNSALRNWPRSGRSKSCNNKLQPLKKVTIQQISVSEKLHTKQQKIRQSVVVLLLHQVELKLVRQRRPPYPKTAHEAAKSRRQRDTSSANAVAASIYQYSKKSHDNSYLVWLNNLIFAVV